MEVIYILGNLPSVITLSYFVLGGQYTVLYLDKKQGILSAGGAAVAFRSPLKTDVRLGFVKHCVYSGKIH